jgi:hypothetical protein
VHFNFYAMPNDQRKETQAQMIAEVRQRVVEVSGEPPDDQCASALGSGEGARRLCHFGRTSRPDLIS